MPNEKKNSQEDEQTLAELSLAHRRSQAKCQLVIFASICSVFCEK